MSTVWLYRAYDSGGRLLYVGIAVDPERRMDQHQREHWYGAIAAIDVRRYCGRRAAKGAETEAIATEWPLWNVSQSPWGCIAADRARQLGGYWRQDKWGQWHPVRRSGGEPRSWDAAAERLFRKEFRHQCHIRRLVRAAMLEDMVHPRADRVFRGPYEPSRPAISEGAA